MLVGLSALCGLVAVIAGLVTLVLRWRRARGDERQQLKWFLAGIAPLPLAALLHDVSNAAGEAAISVLFVVLAAVLGVAILRYRLYDLQLVIRRTLAYAVVSGLIAALYVGVVAAVEGGIGGHAPLAVHVVAAVAAAVTFAPLRARVQLVIDRMFYGDRARPYEAVARLSRPAGSRGDTRDRAAGRRPNHRRGAAAALRRHRTRRRRWMGACRCARRTHRAGDVVPPDLPERSHRPAAGVCPQRA